MKKIEIFILGTLALLLAGCTSTVSPQFYTLSPSLTAVVSPSTNIAISVGPISIPADVDRPQIVVRTGPNQVTLAEFDRWASPLKAEIARVVSENLVSMLGTPQVTVFPQCSAEEATYRVGIDILRFESEPGKAAAMDVLWTVNSRKDGLSRSVHTKITEPTQNDGYDELAAAHSRALGRLSAEIARTIRELEIKKP